MIYVRLGANGPEESCFRNVGIISEGSDFFLIEKRFDSF
jgi:hypothetical protein